MQRRDAVVRAQRVVIEPAFAFAPPDIENLPRAVDQRFVVRKQNSAFARRHHLAVLKTERSEGAEAARAPSVPFRAVRVRRIFDERKSVFARRSAVSESISAIGPPK